MSVRRAAEMLGRCCWIAFFVVLVAEMYIGFSWLWAWIPLGVGLVLYFVPRGSAGADDRQAVEVAAPVSGRWRALNSPADKVPSHGTREYAQAYAIDIVAEPAGEPRPAFGWWPVARRNADFPGFGAPVLAVADAVVVRVADGGRDHLSRNSYPALVYLVGEGVVRLLGGLRRIVGNHVVLDLGDGTYALYAHLERGSIGVRVGERVRVGAELARCGNSGNSSEPHVHFQLMDGPDATAAQGLPFTWRGIGVPAGNEVFEVPGVREAPEMPGQVGVSGEGGRSDGLDAAAVPGVDVAARATRPGAR
jgi:hypothetical protein